VLHPPSQVAAAADEQLPHGNLYLGRALINAQIAAPPLWCHRGLLWNNSSGCPKNIEVPKLNQVRV